MKKLHILSLFCCWLDFVQTGNVFQIISKPQLLDLLTLKTLNFDWMYCYEIPMLLVVERWMK